VARLAGPAELPLVGCLLVKVLSTLFARLGRVVDNKVLTKLHLTSLL
jgi:hypothetical protein